MNLRNNKMKKAENALRGKSKSFIVWGCIFVAIGFVLNIVQTRYDFSGIISSSKFLFILAGISAIIGLILKMVIKDDETEDLE